MPGTLKIILNYSKPVELTDISLSLLSLAAEFQRFSERSEHGVPGSKLYLHRVEQGSLIAELVAKDQGGQWVISQNGQVYITVNYQQANALQHSAAREKALLDEPITGLHQQVALTFQQTRNNPAIGNRAKVESIYPLPVKTVFSNDNVHQSMLMDDDNPLTGIYLVDVRVETVNGKPVLYKITAFHERLDGQ